MPIACDRLDSVHKNVLKPGRANVWCREGGLILHRGGVENDEVSPGALANLAAILQLER